jgi:hypothetical protein
MKAALVSVFVAVVISLIFLFASVHAQAELTSLTVNVTPSPVPVNEPVTFSGTLQPSTITQVYLYIFVYAGAGCLGVDNPAVHPIYTATPLIINGAYSVTVASGFSKAGSYSVAALYALTMQYVCRNFTVVTPIPEFPNPALLLSVALLSVYVGLRAGRRKDEGK